MNLAGGFAAGAGADALERVLTRARLEQLDRQRARQDDRRLDLEAERNRLSSDLQREQSESLREHREAVAKLRAQQGADKIADDLRIGQDLSPDTIATLTQGGRGDLVKGATLGSTNIGGDLMRGQLRMTPNPGRGPSYLGTAAQQQTQEQRDRLQAMLDNPDTPADVRQWLSVSAASPNRGSLPASLLPKDNQPVYERGANGQLRQIGTVPEGSRIVNPPRAATATDPTSRLRGRLSMDDPSLPRGVQQYLVQLRSKYPNFEGAQREFSEALTALQRDHPSLQPTKALTALRQQYGGGGRDADAVLDALLGGGDAPNAGGPRASGGGGGRGAAPGAGAAPMGGPARDKTVSVQDLQDLAQARGTTVEQERERAARSGFVVR